MHLGVLLTTLHLDILYVRDQIRKHSQAYADRMEKHPNILTKLFMRSVKTPRRLKGRFSQELSI
jgi:hypothetical protein